MKNVRLTVGRMMTVGFGLLVCFLIGGAGFGLYFMNDIEDRLVQIADVRNKQADYAVSMRLAVNQAGSSLRTMLLVRNERELDAEIQDIKGAWEAYDKEEDALGDMFTQLAGTSPEENALLARIRQHGTELRPVFDKAQALAAGGQTDEAVQLLRKELNSGLREWVAALGQLDALEDKLNEEAATAAKARFKFVVTLTLISSSLAVVLAAVVGTLITRRLLKQLGGEPAYAAEMATRIAAGDLTAEVVTKQGDTTSLLHAMKQMHLRLVDVVSRIRAGADSIATGSREIATGNADLSQRTEEQASNLQQTAASMEQLSGTVKTNADAARQASQLASLASTSAAEGSTVVGRVVDSMSEISAASKKIADIIGLIDSIAFQTNILALNAAVEAARAGEQGRGFAVVAAEVRSLAQRSAGAAKEIKQLIQASTEKVSEGNTQAAEAGFKMDEILRNVRRVTDLMGEINAATSEQTEGITQVSGAVSQLDQVTQQNAALVEEAAAAADSLHTQADKLVEAVAVFQVPTALGTASARATTAGAFHTPVASFAQAQPVARQAIAKAHASAVPAHAAVPAAKLASRTPADDGEWETF